ncbi:(2Fe-2S)-binding protein [Kitasatospora sp. NPDC086009]|uniref:(2Fe-2S)-binding protein n=1 Tax=unclassified Kitasatospora TaxID=2633591 RepID=UPI0037C6E924
MTTSAPDYRRLSAVGPYFALDSGASPAEAAPPGFRPLRELYAHGPRSPLAERVRVVAHRLGTAEPRVAASILHLGLAARFCSVGLGAAVLLGTVPALDPYRAYVRIPEQGPIDLWTPHEAAPHEATSHEATPHDGTPHGRTPDHRAPDHDAPHPPQPPAPAPTGPRASDEQLADRLHHVLVQRQLTLLAAAVRAAVPLSGRLLDGNAASALAGALRMLDAHAAPGRARALVAAVLRRPPLADTGELRGTGFRRTSCCLYYRVGPGTGVCGDCCFTSPPGPRRPEARRPEPRRPEPRRP